MWKKLLLAVCLGGLCLSACAADKDAAPADKAASTAAKAVTPAEREMVQKALHGLSDKIQVDWITMAPMPGFYQVIASGQMVYVSTDGKYVMHGEVIDLPRKRNISADAWALFRKAQLATIPASQRLIYGPANPKYTVTVFTDVSCGFCRALHEHMAELNKEGIAVEYLAWPREGLTTTAGRPTPTYTEMVSIWCAADPKTAFSAAMAGKAPPAATCENPVKQHFELGRKMGVDGTPAIFGPDGRLLGGYLTPEQMLQALKQEG